MDRSIQVKSGLVKSGQDRSSIFLAPIEFAFKNFLTPIFFDQMGPKNFNFKKNLGPKIFWTNNELIYPDILDNLIYMALSSIRQTS